eukprot:1630233-Alexandrium_andersonii.AAC.1
MAAWGTRAEPATSWTCRATRARLPTPPSSSTTAPPGATTSVSGAPSGPSRAWAGRRPRVRSRR